MSKNLNKKLKIAFLHYRVTPNPDYVDLIQELRKRGHRVWFGNRDEENFLSWHDGIRGFATSPGQKYPPQLIRDWPILPGIWNRIAYLYFACKVTKFLNTSDLDIVHFLQPQSFPQIFPLLLCHDIKSILVIKQMNLGVGKGIVTAIKDWVETKSVSFSARFLYHHTIFDYHRTALAILGSGWNERASAIPLGLNPRLSKVKVKVPFHDHSSIIHFIYIGTISKFRKLEKVIQAAVIAAEINDRFVVDIVGPNRVGNYYQNLVEQLGAGHWIKIKDPVPYENIPDLLTTYDVGFAYTPDYLIWHHQPTTKVLEYCAVGLPMLATDVAAHRDLIEPGKNGVLVKDNVQCIADGMLKFVENPEFLLNCYQNAQKMRHAFTVKDTALRYEQVYQIISAGKE